LKNPFYENLFIEKLCEFSNGKILTIEPIPIIYKNFLIKRAYSLPYGFYGGFKHKVDIQFLKEISKKFFKFYIYDFENKIENLDFLNKKEVFTYILEVPDSFEKFLKNVSKNRYKSIKKLYNKAKKFNLKVISGFEFFDKFYEAYSNVYKKHHKLFKKENILKLRDFMIILNVLKDEFYLGGIAILKINNYGLLWISGYNKYENFSIGEFLFCCSVNWAIENKLEFLDFGLETTETIGFIKSSFGTIRYKYNVWYKNSKFFFGNCLKLDTL